jgi:hypothetical protein
VRTLVLSLTLPVLLAWGAAAQAADTTKSKNIMAGEWKITTVGKKGEWGQDPKALGQTFTLTFEEKAVKGKAISGKPFGFEIISSRYSRATAGGVVSFTTTYDRGGNPYEIQWKGKLNKEGTAMTAGAFSFILGSGTFTAEKQ